MNNIYKEFCVIFEQAELVAAKVGKQVNRDSTEADSPEAYYGQVFANSLTDELISELELRFPKLSHSVSRVLFLTPTVITKVLLDNNGY